MCVLAGEEPARERHSFVCIEQRGLCEEQMFVPNVLSSTADERKLFIIVTKDILVVILKMSHFFPLVSNPSEALVPPEAGSYHSARALARTWWAAGGVAPGEGQDALHESRPAEGFTCKGESWRHRDSVFSSSFS